MHPRWAIRSRGPTRCLSDRRTSARSRDIAGLTLTSVRRRGSPRRRRGLRRLHDEGRSRERDPSIETVYRSDRRRPGLGSSPTYIHSQAEAAIDWRPSAGYARSGGYLRRDVPRLHRSRRHVQFPPSRWRNHPAPAVTAGELGHLVAGPCPVDARRRRHRAVLPDAVPRQRQHAARLLDRPVSRSAQPC